MINLKDESPNNNPIWIARILMIAVAILVYFCVEHFSDNFNVAVVSAAFAIFFLWICYWLYKQGKK